MTTVTRRRSTRSSLAPCSERCVHRGPPRVDQPPTPCVPTIPDHIGRAHLDRRVQHAQREAGEWTSAAPNGERLGAYFSSYGTASLTSPTAGGQTLADYTVLLEEWDVPGIRPPTDIGAEMAARWTRSVTLAVLRDLRRDGHLS